MSNAVPAPRWRLPFMMLGLLSLLGGLTGGLVRLGWPLPASAEVTAFHGPVMVAGFLGTVIGLERALAYRHRWAYAGPAASGLGALAVGASLPAAPWLMALASAVMALVCIRVARAHVALYTVVMTLGACAWLVGQVLWLAGRPIHRVAYWWVAFLVLTIAGERLELSRFLRLGAGVRAAFVGAIAAFLLGVVATWLDPDAGVRTAGAAMLAMAAWLGAFDVARRTVRSAGVTRFVALALLSGYAWLGVGGLLALRFGGVAAGPHYDAILHAIFVGFVFSMIFGHAPIIVPAVLGARVAYRPAFYVPLGLLHASLALRLVGDWWPWWQARRWGGLLNAVAIILFFATLAYGVRVASSRSEPAYTGAAGGHHDE